MSDTLKAELISLAKGAALAAGGAVAAYLTTWAAGSPEYGPLVGAVVAVALNTLRKWGNGSLTTPKQGV